jgi:hypothetical protein
MSPQNALAIADRFWKAVWVHPQDFDAIDHLVTEDFMLVSGGRTVHSRAEFKVWAQGFADRINDLHFETIESFANPEGTRVATRWILTGRNNGVMGLEPDQQLIDMTGTAILAIRPDGLIQSNHVERSAWEVYDALRKAVD